MSFWVSLFVVIFKVYDLDCNGKVTFNDMLDVLRDLTGQFISEQQREVGCHQNFRLPSCYSFYLVAEKTEENEENENLISMGYVVLISKISELTCPNTFVRL